MSREVLLLNSSEEIMKVIDWKKAVKLLSTGKAKKPYNYNKTYSIRTVRGEYKIPAAIVLVRFVYLPYEDHSPTCNSKKGHKLLKECGMKLKNKPTKPKRLALQLVGLDSSGKELWSRWIDLT